MGIGKRSPGCMEVPPWMGVSLMAALQLLMASCSHYSTVPVPVRNLSQVRQISAGGVNTCALRKDGTVYCWGAAGHGALGHGTLSYKRYCSIGTACVDVLEGLPENSAVPLIVTGVEHAVAVTTGDSFACALIEDGSIRCWGHNVHGEVGNGTITDESPWGVSPAVTVSGITTATAIDAGPVSTCALLAGGTVQCWGNNNFGELGNGARERSPTPVAVKELTNVKAIAAGGAATCALLMDGTGKCWGWNIDGALGNEGLLPFSENGKPWPNSAGRRSRFRPFPEQAKPDLGLGFTVSSVPLTVSQLEGATAISCGARHSCALLAKGTVQCWGGNLRWQLSGKDPTYESVVTQITVGGRVRKTVETTFVGRPVIVTGLEGVTALAAGDYHTCAVLRDGTVKCWGDNEYGQLGNDSTSNSNVPVAVAGIRNAIGIAAGMQHTCALLADETVSCWGNNGRAQLGS